MDILCFIDFLVKSSEFLRLLCPPPPALSAQKGRSAVSPPCSPGKSSTSSTALNLHWEYRTSLHPPLLLARFQGK